MKREDDKKGYTPHKHWQKRGHRFFAGGEVFIYIHVVVGIKRTAQDNVCASTINYHSHSYHHCIRTAQRPTACGTSTLLSKKPKVMVPARYVRVTYHLRTANVHFFPDEPHIITYMLNRENTMPKMLQVVPCSVHTYNIPVLLYAVAVVDVHTTKYQVAGSIRTMIRVHKRKHFLPYLLRLPQHLIGAAVGLRTEHLLA